MSQNYYPRVESVSHEAGTPCASYERGSPGVSYERSTPVTSPSDQRDARVDRNPHIAELLPTHMALPTVSKASILKQTSDKTPFEFLTEKPWLYKVSNDGSIPTLSQGMIVTYNVGF